MLRVWEMGLRVGRGLRSWQQRQHGRHVCGGCITRPCSQLKCSLSEALLSYHPVGFCLGDPCGLLSWRSLWASVLAIPVGFCLGDRVGFCFGDPMAIIVGCRPASWNSSGRSCAGEGSRGETGGWDSAAGMEDGARYGKQIAAHMWRMYHVWWGLRFSPRV